MGYHRSEEHRRQARAALELADAVRYARADLKDRLHADPTWHTLIDVIAGERDRDVADRITVLEVLDAAPGIGPAKVRRLCREAGLRQPAMRRRLGDLDDGERLNLAWRLRVTHRRLSYTALERIAATPRDWNRAHAGRAAA